MSGYNMKLIRHLEEQGATVKKTKKGILVLGPEGGSVTMHNTPSDRRSLSNEKALLRRIGLEHVEEKKKPKGSAVYDSEGYASYITSGETSGHFRKVLLAALRDRGWPTEVTVKELRDIGHVTTVARGLYSIGYRYPEGSDKKGRDRIWVAPESIVDLHEVRGNVDRIAETAPSVTEDIEAVPEPAAPAPQPAPTQEPVIMEEPEVVEEDNGREYIDSVNSWTVDTDYAPRSHMPQAVQDYLAGLRAAGLEVEIRVWRKP